MEDKRNDSNEKSTGKKKTAAEKSYNFNEIDWPKIEIVNPLKPRVRSFICKTNHSKWFLPNSKKQITLKQIFDAIH